MLFKVWTIHFIMQSHAKMAIKPFFGHPTVEIVLAFGMKFGHKN